MSKKKISNSTIDTLLLSAGKSKVVTQTSRGTSKIENSEDRKVKIKILSSAIREDGENIYEVCKIRIDATDGRKATISNAISIGSVFSNHQTSIPKMVDVNEEDSGDVSLAASTFSIDSKFNYISRDYDNLQSSVDEWNLNSFLDNCSKDEILNFKKRKNSRVTKFTRGDRMRNFVIPQNIPAKFMSESPYYVKIGLNDTISGGISKFLEKISIYDEFLNAYLTSNKLDIKFDIQQDQLVSENSNVLVYDVDSFFNSEHELDLNNFYGLNQSPESSKMSYDLRKHLFKGFLKNSTETGFRTYEQIYNNIECSKEVLCYSIEKFDQFEIESARVQNLYAPATTMSTSIIDTQVKYGKTYVYKATGHYMIIGNSYSYRNIKYFVEDKRYYATAEVVNRPFIGIVPINLFSSLKTIIQPPPVKPQVTFRTENNSTKEIQIYLSPTKSEIEDYFIPITQQDENQRVLLESFYSKTDGKAKFSTDVGSGLFEVFRMTEPPKDISDFANKKLGEVRMSFRTTDAIFKDKVASNVDYYYLFRQLNEKGLVSNPTAIYKARLVVDADDAMVILDTYEIPKRKTSQPRIEFKSMMQIRPAIEQVVFEEAQPALFEKNTLAGTLDQLVLGLAKHKVWDRKFKLRVKSKTSGKIIDINIDFSLAKNKTKEEF